MPVLSSPPAGPAKGSRRPLRWLFRTVAILVGLGLALVVVEFGLLQWRRHLAQSELLDPGFIRPDPRRGWKLSPGWTGRHRHHDFDVQYSVGSDGFRHDPHLSARTNTIRPVAVVGDSYTFGFGVKDGETFVSVLNGTGTNRFLNFGVPGYSTDQELLLIEEEVLGRNPALVVLVVYLGNDLLDNVRSQPLQVAAAKPWFLLEGTNLVFQAPGAPPSGPTASAEGASSVLGRELAYAWRQRLENGSATARLLSQALPAPSLGGEFSQRHSHLVSLFAALLDRMQKACLARGAVFELALLGNAALLDQPRSVTGQFQDHLRREILKLAERRGIPVIDLSAALAARRPADGPWYHPHEGHLTPAGHRAVAEILSHR